MDKKDSLVDRAMRRAGLRTQEELATLLRLSQSSISRWALYPAPGRRSPPGAYLMLLRMIASGAITADLIRDVARDIPLKHPMP